MDEYTTRYMALHRLDIQSGVNGSMSVFNY